MISKIVNLTLVIIFAVLVLLFAYKEIGKTETVTAVIDDSTSQKHDSLSKENIEQIVKNYILNNPEDLIKSVENLHEKHNKKLSIKIDEYINNNFDKFTTQNLPPYFGNPDGDIKIIVFFDYKCGYCHKSYLVEQQLISQDQNIQIILRPIPVLGDKSLYLTKIALAVHKVAPELFANFHHDLMTIKDDSIETIQKLFDLYQINPASIENEINSYHMKQLIGANLEFARGLHITGTPFYLIDNQIIKGLPTLERLKQVISTIRAKNNG
ncbi:MAG: thioredoxin domain-containing protein [Rickettsiaceae bacterium]|nr:thioredoxin domain-containing protein [Rickettsiaceae bacterium]